MATISLPPFWFDLGRASPEPRWGPFTKSLIEGASLAVVLKVAQLVAHDTRLHPDAFVEMLGVVCRLRYRIVWLRLIIVLLLQLSIIPKRSRTASRPPLLTKKLDQSKSLLFVRLWEIERVATARAFKRLSAAIFNSHDRGVNEFGRENLRRLRVAR